MDGFIGGLQVRGRMIPLIVFIAANIVLFGMVAQAIYEATKEASGE